MKNKIFLSIIFALLLIGSSLYVRYRANVPRDQDIKEQSLNMDDSGTKALFDDSIVEVYKDPVYHFRISYPSYLTPTVEDAVDHQIIGFVNEAYPEDMGVMGIVISTTTALSARAWVEESNQVNYTGVPPNIARLRVEREIMISGILAVIVHPYSDFQGQHEEFTYEKSVLLVKDGKLFTISARTTDPEKIWNSFRFE